MRGLDPAREQVFFDIFADYFDMERDTNRSYTHDEYSLDRMLPLAAAAGEPQKRLRVIHVAGTKGKGSTCHFVAALLASAGRRCGLFASPHLVTVRERLQIDGELLDYERLIHYARTFEACLRNLGLTPTLFEILTILGLKLFADEGCEFAILETGIGGRLDATNFVPNPVCCGITPISFDHTLLLGDTIEAIAAEKAGIIKPGIPVVIGRQPFPAAEGIVRARAAALGSPVLAPSSPEQTVPFITDPHMPSFLRENLSVAHALVSAAGVEPDPARFEQPELRGRCEVIHHKPLVVLDAAHNADSARRLVEALEEGWPNSCWTVVLGVIKGKDTAGMVRELSRLQAHFVLTNPRSHRASDLEYLVECSRQAGLSLTIAPDLQEVGQLPADRPLVFTGSFFTALLGDILFGADEELQAGAVPLRGA